MANASTWTTGHPSGTSLLRDFDDLHRSDKSILEATWLQEHYFKDGSAGSAGVHKRGSARVYVGTASQVSVAGDDGRLMWATDQNRLFYLSSVSTVQLPSLATANTWEGTQSFSTKIQANNGFRVPDGSIATPSVQIGQDNLGFWRSAADVVSITHKFSTPASTTTQAGFQIAHGVFPTTPTNGDMWSTTTGLFVRINGTTYAVTLA